MTEENVEQGLSQQEPAQDSALQTPQGDQPHPPVEETDGGAQKDESASAPIEQTVEKTETTTTKVPANEESE